MRNLVVAATIAITASFSGFTQAQEAYVGFSFSQVDYFDTVDTYDLNAGVWRLGTNFNENFSGEIRAGFGVSEDAVNLGTLDVNVGLDRVYGAYLRGGIPVFDSFFPYVVVGYTRGKISVSAPGFPSVSTTESDTSFGLGLDFDVSESITVNAEYMNYFDKDEAEIDAFSLGIIFRF